MSSPLCDIYLCFDERSGEQPRHHLVSGLQVIRLLHDAARNVNGEIGWDTFIGGYRYEYCLHATIVDSNNDIAKGMWDYLGGYQPYRHILAPYMGEDPDTVEEKFYENNFFTPRQMIYALRLLATESERFPKWPSLRGWILPP